MPVEHGFLRWCDTVTDQVRFKPDRKAIAKELAAHYEDHVRDLERLDYPLKLAKQRALLAMGDPEEVGRGLDRVHKPWLGWLWKISRWLLAIAGLLLVWSVMICGLPDLEAWLRPTTTLGSLSEDDGRALVCPPDVKMGPYTLHTEEVRYAEGAAPREGKDTLLLSMTSVTWCFWLEGPSFDNCLEAVDSNGAHYTAYHSPYISGSGPNTGHFQNAFWLQVDGIENDPEWIEITYQLTGWTLHVDLPGGEEGTP